MPNGYDRLKTLLDSTKDEEEEETTATGSSTKKSGKDRLDALLKKTEGNDTPANTRSKAAYNELLTTGQTTYGGKTYTLPEGQMSIYQKYLADSTAGAAQAVAQWGADQMAARKAAEPEPTANAPRASAADPTPWKTVADYYQPVLEEKKAEANKPVPAGFANAKSYLDSASTQNINPALAGTLAAGLRAGGQEYKPGDTRPGVTSKELYTNADLMTQTARAMDQQRDQMAQQLVQNPSLMYDADFTQGLNSLNSQANATGKAAGRLMSEYERVTNLRNEQEEKEKYGSLYKNEDYIKYNRGDADLAKKGESATDIKLNRYTNIYRRQGEQEWRDKGGDPTLSDAESFLTDREAGNYFYIAGKQGLNAANEYYKNYLKADAEARKNQAVMEYTQNKVANGNYATKLAYSGASIVMNKTSVAGMLDLTFQNLRQRFGDASKPINYNTKWQLASNQADAIVKQVSNDIAKDVAKAAEGTKWEKYTDLLAEGATFLYQTVLSTIDSGSSALLVGMGLPEQITLGLMAGNAGMSAIRDAKERGASDGQALASGYAAAFAEYMFEKVSLDQLLEAKNIQNFGQFVKEFNKQGFVEGSEEFATEWATTLTDLLINGDKSSIGTDEQSYMANGVSENEARKAAAWNWTKNIAMSFLGGYLSGGLMQGGNAAVNIATGGNSRLNLAAQVQVQMAVNQAINDNGRVDPDAVRMIENNPEALNMLRGTQAMKNGYRGGETGKQQIQSAIREIAKQERTARTVMDHAQQARLMGEYTRMMVEAEQQEAVPTEQNRAVMADLQHETEQNSQLPLQNQQEAAQRRATPPLPQQAGQITPESVTTPPVPGDAQRGAESAERTGESLISPSGTASPRGSQEAGAESQTIGNPPVPGARVDETGGNNSQENRLRIPKNPQNVRNSGDNSQEARLRVAAQEQTENRESGSGLRIAGEKSSTKQQALAQQRQRQEENTWAESLRDRGFQNAGEGESVYVRSEERWDEEERAVAEALRAEGIEPVFVTGLLQDAQGNKVNYLRDGNRIAIQADNLRQSVQSIAERAVGKKLLDERAFESAGEAAIEAKADTRSRPVLTIGAANATVNQNEQEARYGQQAENPAEQRTGAGEAEGGAAVSAGDGGRGTDQRSGGQAGKLAESAEEWRSLGQRSKAARRRLRAESKKISGTDGRELGIYNADGEVTVYPESEWEDDLRNVAERVQKATGLPVTFVLGEIPIKGAGTARARGVMTGDRIIVQCDHPTISAAKLASHEAFHAWAERNSEQFKKLADGLIREMEKRQGGNRIMQTVDAYLKKTLGISDLNQWHPSETEKREAIMIALEEFCADAYGGINAYGQNAGRYQQFIRDNVYQQSETAAATDRRTGPPSGLRLPMPADMEKSSAEGVSGSKETRRDLRDRLIRNFSIPDGYKTYIKDLIGDYEEKILKNGSLTEDEKEDLFDELYESGARTVAADEATQAARDMILKAKIYVPESVKHEFSDDWADFQRQAFGQKIILTNNPADQKIDVFHQEIADAFPHLFDPDDTDPRSILENIVKVADEGKGKSLSLAEYNRSDEGHLEGDVFETEGELRQALREDRDRALEDFAGRTGSQRLSAAEPVYNSTALLTEETVDKWIREYAAKSSPKYAQAYVTRMTPEQFLRLTTSRTGRLLIGQQTGQLNEQQLIESTREQPLQLRIENGEVVGHEGRHRATALNRADVGSIPVLIFDSSNKYSKADTPEMTLNGQDFGNTRSYARETLRDLIPLSYENRDRIVEEYGKQPGSEKVAEKYGRNTIRFSASDDTDAEYMAAAEAGDTETAQRMVDEAAEKAGFPIKAYHGTRSFGFTVFDTSKTDDGISLFATSSPVTAETYSGKTTRNRIKDRSTINADDLHGEELIEEARKYNKRYNDYKLMSDKDKETVREDAKSSIGWSIRRAQEFVRDHNGAFDSDKSAIMDRLISALYHLRDSETENDISEAWNEWEDAVWDLKGMDDSIALEFLDDVDSRGIFQSKNELDDMTYQGDMYADRYAGGPDYIFDNQLQIELNAELNKGIYELYGKPGKQLVVEADGANWNQITPPKELQDFGLTGPQRTRDIASAAKALKYDSVLFKNLRDNGGETPYNGESDVYIFFDPHQLKSADPVTYDDNGNVIPLSERFNPEEKDIRYSAAEERELGSREVLDTPALRKLGVKVSGSVGEYGQTAQLIAKDRAAKELQKEAARAERRLKATDAEKEFANGITAGIYREEDIPKRLNRDTVMELADYYWAVNSANLQTLHQLRTDINQGLRDDAAGYLEETDIRPISMIELNERTPERAFRKMFGDNAEAITKWLLDPVKENTAEADRWYNKQMDAVRKFTDSKGKSRELTRAESALTMRFMEGRAAADMVAGMEMKAAITNAAENIRKGGDAGDAAREFGLSGQERDLAEKYAGWLSTQEELKKADSTIVEAAAKKYAELFDDYYNAINDFLVAHGYEPIGYIKGYAPHMQPEENQSLLEKAFEKMGINAAVTELPASIAGQTTFFKPNKRWDPYFLHRTGTEAEYDIVKAYQSYVDYMTDILFHTDDVMRVRQTANWIRQTYAPEEIRANLDWAQGLRNASTEEKQRLLRDAGEIGQNTVLSAVDTTKAMQEYIDKLYERISNSTKNSNLVMWLDNYANILAGKQSFADRGWEYSTGRKSLNLANKLNNAFQKANVAGNLSSALNQTAQLPMIAAELGERDFLKAAADLASGKTKAWAQDSDFLTSKAGREQLYTDNAEKFVNALFTPASVSDYIVSTIAVRGAFNKAIRQGASYAEAMKKADEFGTAVMGSRAKGSRPLAYESKGFFSKMVHMFQIEAVNSWDHIVSDVPYEIRRIAKTDGKGKAAGALAALIVRALVGAFTLNRLAEELYGGTPAPFDILGLTANFVASGKGLTTNQYIRTIIDNTMEKMGHERLFGTEPKTREDFDLEAAADDLLYNVMNDVPLVRNVAGMLGLGDQTIALPGAGGEFKAMGTAIKNLIKDGREQGEVENLLRATLLAATQFVPGGRQISKTAQGAEAILRGGSYNSYKAPKLQYPLEDATDIVKALLFGKNATNAAQEYWASGGKQLTEKQTALYTSLASHGVGRKEAYDAIQKYRRIANDDSLTSYERGKAERALLAGLDIPDEDKLDMYRELNNAESKAAKFRDIMDKGLSFDQAMTIQDKYAEIDGKEGLKAGDKAKEFYLWVDNQSYTANQKTEIKNQLKYFQSIPAEAARYDKLTASGLSPDMASKIDQAIGKLEPEAGKTDVSDYQKWRAALNTVTGEANQKKALQALMTEEQYAKFEEANVSPGVYVDYKEFANKTSSTRDENKKEVKGETRKDKLVAYIDGLKISSAEKDSLFLLEYKESGLSDTPWHSGGGKGSGSYAMARTPALRIPEAPKAEKIQSGLRISTGTNPAPRQSSGLRIPAAASAAPRQSSGLRIRAK